MEVLLRAATAADSDFCYALHEAALGPYVTAVWGWDEAVQRGFHERGFDPSKIKIIMVNGREAGRLDVERRPDGIFLGLIELLPAYQGRGVGGRLVRDLIAEAAARGQPLSLEVLVVNVRAHALYTRLGFRETGRDEVKVRMRIEVHR
ncbi:GNAT family N-acetyltransferase [Phytohabitans kaempferiae]|uniref:GNAT family N-acetyltransferase n=1 Tax=Phytohabitans kaempferiae TaxID=1620943 RepID=A0ABV6M4S5_9ACTN